MVSDFARIGAKLAAAKRQARNGTIARGRMQAYNMCTI